MREDLIFRSLTQACALGYEPFAENATIYATENEVKYGFSTAVFYADVWRRLHNSPYMDNGDLFAGMNIPGNLDYESDFYTWYILIPSGDKIILRQVQPKEGENAFTTAEFCDDVPYGYSIYRHPRVWQRWVRRRDRGKIKPKNEKTDALNAEISAVEAELKALKERGKE